MKKNRTLFIGSLIETITTKDLDAHFREFGQIKNIVFKNNKIFDPKKTFAYLVFAEKESADQALAIEKHIIKGKRIDCQPAHGGKDKKQDQELMKATKIHLKGLHPDTTSKDLEEHFSQYGELRQAYVVFDAENNSKGFGFIQYYKPEIVSQVIEMSHTLQGKKIKCGQFIPKERPATQTESPKKSAPNSQPLSEDRKKSLTSLDDDASTVAFTEYTNSDTKLMSYNVNAPVYIPETEYTQQAEMYYQKQYPVYDQYYYQPEQQVCYQQYDYNAYNQYYYQQEQQVCYQQYDYS